MVLNWFVKRRHVGFLFSLVGVLSSVTVHTVFAKGPSRPESVCIVTLGDSTTFGYSVEANYPKQLEQRLLDKEGISARVVNAGVNNDTTRSALRRLDEDVLDYRPDVVIIQFGLNDQTMRLYQKPEEITPYISLRDFANNLRSIVRSVRKQGVSPILLTPNPMIWTETLEHHYPQGPYLDPPQGGNRLLTEYVTTVKDVAESERMPVVDIFAAYEAVVKDKPHSISEFFLADGVHPSARGYAMNVELLLPELLKTLRERVEDDGTHAIGGSQ